MCPRGLPKGIGQTNLATLFHAKIAQLGERQTEDLKVPGSIPGLGNDYSAFRLVIAGSRKLRAERKANR